jgi:hypothetical protein
VHQPLPHLGVVGFEHLPFSFKHGNAVTLHHVADPRIILGALLLDNHLADVMEKGCGGDLLDLGKLQVPGDDIGRHAGPQGVLP